MKMVVDIPFSWKKKLKYTNLTIQMKLKKGKEMTVAKFLFNSSSKSGLTLEVMHSDFYLKICNFFFTRIEKLKRANCKRIKEKWFLNSFTFEWDFFFPDRSFYQNDGCRRVYFFRRRKERRNSTTFWLYNLTRGWGSL